LWSLGATLYAAVEGHGPFDGHGSPMAVLASIVHSDPPAARSAGPLGGVIEALLGKDPAQRPDAVRAGQLLADAAGVPNTMTGTGVGVVAASGGAVPATGSPAAADAGLVPTAATVSRTTVPVSAAAVPLSASAVPRVASAVPRFAAAAPVAAGPRPVPVGAGPAAASALTDPLGFAATPPAPASGGAATAQMLADAGPDLFPPASGPGSFPPGAGPALLPAQADPAAPAGAGSPPLPVSMGAAPFPDGTAAVAGLAAPPGAPTAPGRSWLAVGLAAAAIVVAGLAAGLVWSRVMAPAAPSGAPAAAAPLPAGYHWYTRPGAAGGKARGFTLAVPAGWQPRRQGTATYLWNPASRAIISISPAPAAAGSPTWPARVLKRAGLGQGAFASYRRIAEAPFLSRGKLAGAWRLTYREPGPGAVDGLVVVTRASAAGGGSFELVAMAPARHWLGTRIAFAEAVRTFSPGA
jgi:hypothetical protein